MQWQYIVCAHHLKGVTHASGGGQQIFFLGRGHQSRAHQTMALQGRVKVVMQEPEDEMQEKQSPSRSPLAERNI